MFTLCKVACCIIEKRFVHIVHIMQEIVLKGRQYIPLRAKSCKKHKIRMDKTTSNPRKNSALACCRIGKWCAFM